MRLKVKLVVPYYVGFLQRIQHVFQDSFRSRAECLQECIDTQSIDRRAP